MLRRCAPVAVLCLLSATLLAAEPIKLDIADFKLKGSFDGADALLKNEEGKLSFFVNGTATVTLTVPADREYVIVVDASCDEAQKQHAKITVKVGDTTVKENFELTTQDQKEYKFDAKLKKGETTLSIAFTNDAYKEAEFDRNLYIHGVKVEKK